MICINSIQINTIFQLQRGEAIRTHQVSTKSLAKALVSPLKRVESISTQENQSHVLLKCVRINNRLRVKPVSDAFNGK